MCERAVLAKPPVAGTEPVAPQKWQSLYQSEGQLRWSSSTRTVARASSPYKARKGVDNDTNGVAGIDVAKDKVDGCIRSLGWRQTFPSTPQGHRQPGSLASQAQGGTTPSWRLAAAMSASGRRYCGQAGMEVRIVDPKRVRNFALSAGRLAKNDTIDAEMIAWFAETFEAPSQTYDAAREELAGLVKTRKNLVDLKTRLQNQNEHVVPAWYKRPIPRC
ncbi:IS110 family transposase [Bradyrhizobium sp. SZCCHNS1054]|uniref:IS110 family transposase n=1 Tax=Bradyrhizobium sp. SZCCHNS1054 TaxID=3057301 RepID=UPI002916DDD5|nr:transposase [Bradyrhizobium sp. SZCCHNS1054]